MVAGDVGALRAAFRYTVALDSLGLPSRVQASRELARNRYDGRLPLGNGNAIGCWFVMTDWAPKPGQSGLAGESLRIEVGITDGSMDYLCESLGLA